MIKKFHKSTHVWHIEREDGSMTECIMGGRTKNPIECEMGMLRGHVCIKCLDMLVLKDQNPTKYERDSKRRYHLVYHTHTWFYCGEHKIINRTAPIESCEECKKAIKRGMAVDGQDPDYYKKQKKVINERIIARRKQRKTECRCETDENGCLIICAPCLGGYA